MKVLDLRCANGHGFEGWFASEEDFMGQNGRSQIECPLCADRIISRMPSAPRLNLSGTREKPPVASINETPEVPRAEGQAADMQAMWMAAVRHVMANTEDVGPAFAEEARRIHYGEKPERGIRGQVSAEDREALRDEGIETMAIPIPQGLNGPLQ